MQLMLSLIRACAGKRPVAIAVVCLFATLSVAAQKLVKVPTAPPVKGEAKSFHDARYGVRFEVPPGWSLTRKDREVSTFRLDARTAPRKAEMRAVATLDFNPYPFSTLSGALFYYSVEKHTTDRDCALQATVPAHGKRDIQNIGGMEFAHGHDEHGGICVEARDEVYTAFRKGSCYRFDLTVNMFCAVSSGAQEMTERQMHSIEERMTMILSSVALDWEKSGPQPVVVPPVVAEPRHERPLPAPSARIPLNSGGL